MDFPKISSYSVKGQISSYTKPITLAIVVSMFAFTIFNFYNVQTSLQEHRKEIDQNLGAESLFRSASKFFGSSDKLQGSLDIDKITKTYLDHPRTVPEELDSYNNGVSYEIDQKYLSGVLEGSSTKKLQIALVFDVSGSMGYFCDMDSQVENVSENAGIECSPKEEARISHSISAAKNAIDSLNQNDEVAVVSYSSSANVLFDFTSNHEMAKDEVTQMKAGGGTAIGNGLRTAKDDLSWEEDGERVYIVMTDGIQNRGIHPEVPGSQIRESGDELHGVLFGESASAEHITRMLGNPDPGCSLNQSVNNINNNCWFAAEGRELLRIYNSIETEARSPVRRVGGSHSCSLPVEKELEGSLELVFAGGASKQHQGEWGGYCSMLDSVRELDAQGLNVSTAAYSPSNIDEGKFYPPDKGGEPMNVSGETYNYSKSNLNIPSCVAQSDSVNKGISEWNTSENFNSSRDYGLNAWGVQAKWILENHDWNTTKNNRKLVISADHLPHGGEVNQGFVNKSREVKLIKEISELADEKNVEIVVSPTFKLSYNRNDKIEGSQNDALFLMNKIEQYGGERINSIELLNYDKFIEQEFTDYEQVGEACKSKSFSIGEQPRRAEYDRYSYPMTIKLRESLTIPGSLNIDVSSKDIDRLRGMIEKVGDTGLENTREISLDRAVTTRTEEIGRNRPTNYTLDFVGEHSYNGNITLGIDAKPIFKDLSKSHVKGKKFEAYPNASLQFFLYLEEKSVVPPIKLECGGSCGQFIKKNTSTVRPGLGFYNFTEINDGNKDIVERDAVCYSGTDNCRYFRNNVSNFNLSSGTHILNITTTDDEVVVNR